FSARPLPTSAFHFQPQSRRLPRPLLLMSAFGPPRTKGLISFGTASPASFSGPVRHCRRSASCWDTRVPTQLASMPRWTSIRSGLGARRGREADNDRSTNRTRAIPEHAPRAGIQVPTPSGPSPRLRLVHGGAQGHDHHDEADHSVGDLATRSACVAGQAVERRARVRTASLRPKSEDGGTAQRDLYTIEASQTLCLQRCRDRRIADSSVDPTGNGRTAPLDVSPSFRSYCGDGNAAV